MTARGRRLAALAIVAVTLASLRLLLPDPAQRRDCMLLLMVPLGYGHVAGALLIGKGRSRRVWQFSGFTIGILAVLLAAPGGLPIAFVLAVLAAWHVMENDLADAGRGRLPPLPRAGRRHLGPLFATVAVVTLAAATPWLTQPALRAGVPVELAAWNAEEVFAAVLYYHVVSWVLHAARAGRRYRVFALHALPLALSVAGALAWPAAHALATAPAPYLVLSVAHALHTVWERGLDPGA